jgi:hypothetical protein
MIVSALIDIGLPYNYTYSVLQQNLHASRMFCNDQLAPWMGGKHLEVYPVQILLNHRQRPV